MKDQNNKLFNRDMKQAISLAIKIKDQYDKSKNNPRDYSELKSDFNNELYVDGGAVRIMWEVVQQRAVKVKIYIDWQLIYNKGQLAPFFMKLKNILKTIGALHIMLGLLIISLLIFSVETIAGDASSETLLLVRGTADVVAASNLGIGCLLIICSSIKDKASLRKVLSGELALMFCFLAVALFNTFNAGTIVDGGPPPPFWIVLIVNPLLCIYGLVNNKNWNAHYLHKIKNLIRI